MPSPAAAMPDKLDEPARARYGVSRRLGDVEFLDARFSGHRFAPHSHPVFAIGAVRAGACTIWHDGTPHVARPGDLVMLDPHAPHAADQCGGGTWDYCAIYVPRETLSHWLPATAARASLAGVVGHDPALAQALAALCRDLGDDPEQARAEHRCAAFLRALFSGFGTAPSGARERAGARGPEVVRAYLDDNYHRPVRLEALAAMAGLSTFALIRAFSRAYGMPPYRYLTQVRVSRAQALLRQGRPISDTAFATGFSDQAHLTRFFRRIVGVPPGVWVRGVAARATFCP